MPARTPDLEHHAERMRNHRRALAGRMMDARRAAQAGDKDARQRLGQMRHGAARTLYPNPDRKSDCERHARRAALEYVNATARPENTASKQGAARFKAHVEAAQRLATLMSELARTAPDPHTGA